MNRSASIKPRPQSAPPFLRSIDTTEVHPDRFPFTIPALHQGLHLQISRPVTMLVGENGSGKSTILEGIAAKCGFNLMGGNRNHNYSQDRQNAEAAPFLRLSWSQKVNDGFLMRAESLFDLASYLDILEADEPGALRGYGGKSLHAQSHGEAFLSLFQNRFRKGLYILDEPEAALSPQRQLSFMRIIHDLEKGAQAQFIIATHSPLLLSYPGASVFSMSPDGIEEVDYRDTDHYQLTKQFLDAPERYFRHLFSDEN